MFMMCRISFGILFHSLGAMLENALSPYVFVRDLGSSNSLFETERNDLELFEQLNSNCHGASILPHHLRPITSTLISPLEK